VVADEVPADLFRRHLRVAQLPGCVDLCRLRCQTKGSLMPQLTPARCSVQIGQTGCAVGEFVTRRPRATWSVCKGSSIAISRESIFEVGPTRSGRLSMPWRALAGRRKIGWRWDERLESLLCCVDLEARVSRSSIADDPQAYKRNSSDAAFADRTVRRID
jgi:hypothetical protein